MWITEPWAPSRTKQAPSRAQRRRRAKMRIQARTDLDRCCLSFETGISDPGKQHGNLGNQAKNDSGSKQRRSWEATRKPGEKILNRGKDTKLTIVYGSNVRMRAVARERIPRTNSAHSRMSAWWKMSMINLAPLVSAMS